MTREERIEKLRHLITCMKCEVGGKSCDNNCPTQYYAGNMGEIIENLEEIAKALGQESCEDVVSRNAIIQTLNNMDRYVANELILCDTNNKFPQNELFIVDDVYEQIAEQLPSVTQKEKKLLKE